MRPSTTPPRSERAMTGPMWAALGSVYVVWGSTYLAIRVAVETMPPLLMAGTRFLIAGVAMYTWTLLRRDPDDRPTRAHWKSAVIIGGLLVGANGILAIAEQEVPSGVASLLIAIVPVWMVLIGLLLFGQRVGRVEWTGLAVGLVGVAVLVDLGGEGLPLTGTALTLLASIAWAVGSVLAPRLALPRRALVAIAIEMLAGGALVTAVGIATGELAEVNLAAFSATSWVAWGFLIVVSSMIVFPAYIWLLGVARHSLVSTYAYVNPVIAVVLGWLILDEVITLETVIGGALIVAAVVLIISAGRPGSRAIHETETVERTTC